MSPAPSVLIVEDDALIALLLEQVLVEAGYEVCARASNQADAVSAALRFKPSLMVVDVQLRDGTGTAAVAEIRRTLPIPCVFLSGAPARVQAHWPDAVVVGKPFRQAALTSAIERAMNTAPSQ